MEVPDAADALTAPHWDDATVWTAPDRIRLDTVDELRGISPAMFAWWFANMDYETYQRFHPRDHQDFAWTRGKLPGRYVGATHRTHHRYGGTGALLRTEITFVEPGRFFPADALAALGDGHALAAVTHPLDPEDRPATVPNGRFIHVVLGRPYGAELRSRWWIEVRSDTDVELVTTGRQRHVHEEFGYLQGFLPAWYARSVR